VILISSYQNLKAVSEHEPTTCASEKHRKESYQFTHYFIYTQFWWASLAFKKNIFHIYSGKMWVSFGQLTVTSNCYD